MLKIRSMARVVRNGRLSDCFLVLCACLSLSFGAWGQACSPSNPLNCAYVTDGTGHDVLAIDRNNGTITTIYSLKANQGNTVDLRLAADNRLYFLTSNALYRVNVDGTGFQTVFSSSSPTGFTGIRFDYAGDAFVNTPGGVWRFANLTGTSSSPFPYQQITSASCSSSGGLAFDAFGDLLIVCNSGSSGSVLECSAPGPTSAPPCGTITLLSNSVPITGLAVDALGDIIYSSGSKVYMGSCGSTQCSTLAGGYPIDLGTDLPAYLEAVPDPTGTSAAAPSSFPCNSAAPSILVSTATSAGTNGKVYSINSVASASGATLTSCAAASTPVALVASLNKKVPAVGMASAATLTTLTKQVTTDAPTSQFSYGNTTLQLLPTSSITTACYLSMTKEQLPAALISNRLATANVAAKAIGFDGEQSWVTGFHGAYPDACGIAASSTTHIGIGGFYPYNNPHIAIIPDDPSVAATVDELPFVYPIAPLQGNPGDILIHNQTVGGAFTTNPATIIAVDVAFTNAPANGYLFCGFLSPFVDTTLVNKKNTVKSGQSATFKFQLGTTSCSNLVSDSTAESIMTGFSVARFAGADHVALSEIVRTGGDGKGNSVAPPTFKYDPTGHQFIYTLDTTGYCNGDYEATANGDIFKPHMMVFSVISAPTPCQ